MGIITSKDDINHTATNETRQKRSSKSVFDKRDGPVTIDTTSLTVTSSSSHSPHQTGTNSATTPTSAASDKRSRSSTLPVSNLFSSKREDNEDDSFSKLYSNRGNNNKSNIVSPHSPNRSNSGRLQIGSSLVGGKEGGGGDDVYSPIFGSTSDSVTKLTNSIVLSTDEEGNKMINEYTVISTLGKGSYGKVKLVLDNNNKPFAIKIMNKAMLKRVKKAGGGNLLMDVQREIAIMKKLSHSNVVRLFEVIDDRNSDFLYLLIEYAENGAILSMSETNTGEAKPCKFRLNQIRSYMKQAIEGVQYLHSQGICHRDIKPENILLDGSLNVKVSDFGVSHICEGSDDTVKGSAGTPAFLSPESCKGESYSGFKSDIWALGVTLYALLYNITPFQGDSYMQIYTSIQFDNFEMLGPFDQDDSLKDLLSRVLDKNPDTRISLENFKNHAWMNATYEAETIPETPRTPSNVEELTTAIPAEDSKSRLLLIVKMKSRMKKAAQQAKASLEEQEKTFNKLQEHEEENKFRALIFKATKSNSKLPEVSEAATKTPTSPEKEQTELLPTTTTTSNL